MKFIRAFEEVTLKDIPLVGGKTASLGQMINDLSKKGISVPTGFAVTADAYWFHLNENNLLTELKKLFSSKKTLTLKEVQIIGKKIRKLITDAPLPEKLEQEISTSYQELCKKKNKKVCSVAVRSSATAEDLPGASFAGQQETYLNIEGVPALLKAYKDCVASLFTDRAIMYRIEKGFDHTKIALSVAVQYMVRSDVASAGVMFTVDTETGFKDSIVITSSYGLGETVVKGEVIPDEFHVFKKTLLTGHDPIIKAQCGQKAIKRVYGKRAPVIVQKVDKEERAVFSLTDEEVIELAHYGQIIEDHYSQLHGAWSPMDIEWAKDGIENKLYIVQARLETVHGNHQQTSHEQVTYKIAEKKAKILAKGQSIGQQAVVGRAIVIHSPADINQVKDGDVVVTQMTDPDWVPIMKKASAIITDSGGRTCHAAIVSRELGISAIVGTHNGTKTIKNGSMITVDCSSGMQGIVYEGALDIVIKKTQLKDLKRPKAKILVNIAAPDRAYSLSQLPVDGVGLARLEFIITNTIQAHPMAFLQPEKISDKRILKALHALTANYETPEDFFVDKVARAVGFIAAAFYPRPVLVRFSDFKSNEYRNLLGGKYFEPQEENPMIGLRGASRYYNPLYAPAFALECEAMRYAYHEMGLDNIQVMIPFVRTTTEAEKCLALIKDSGLLDGQKKPKVYMMCEIPSNVLLIDKFAHYFDGFSIGSNDLTQTTLSVDRDSGILSNIFDERDPAVTMMLEAAIKGAQKAGKPIGICGQAPSDYPEIAQFLLDLGIDSLSFNADSVLPFLVEYSKK